MIGVLDAGALIAVDRRDREIGAVLRVLEEERTPIRTSAGAVAQVWRSGPKQANLARLLRGLEVVPLDDTSARRVGELLAANGSSDPIDAHVALLVDPKGVVVTGDHSDIEQLLHTRGVRAGIIDI